MALSRARLRQVQTLLQAAGYYKEELDGLTGPKTRLAVDTLLNRRASEATTNPARWSADRRAVGAAQLVLKHAGWGMVGAIDGYWGNATEGAWLEWDHKRKTGTPLELPRTPVEGVSTPSPIFPLQKDMNVFYGVPGPAIVAQLVTINFPYPMRIDWNLKQVSKKAQLHKKCAPSALVALNRAFDHYGYERLRELGLDRNAGTYNHRKMRGGSSWSTHAYGCAWDFYAAPNGLNTRAPAALFSKPEYKAWFDIWESVGWVSLGRAIDRDYMHVQAARL